MSLGALVLDRDAAQRVVLALGVAHPVVGHGGAGQVGVAVEDDAHEGHSREHGLPRHHSYPHGDRRLERFDVSQDRIVYSLFGIQQ